MQVITTSFTIYALVFAVSPGSPMSTASGLHFERQRAIQLLRALRLELGNQLKLPKQRVLEHVTNWQDLILRMPAGKAVRHNRSTAFCGISAPSVQRKWSVLSSQFVLPGVDEPNVS